MKGWLEDGEARERVLDVAGGDNGAGVDLATCEPRGAGASSLCAVWSDPDFDPASPAYYYARCGREPLVPLEPVHLPGGEGGLQPAGQRARGTRGLLRRGAPAGDPGARLELADLVLAHGTLNAAASRYGTRKSRSPLSSQP